MVTVLMVYRKQTLPLASTWKSPGLKQDEAFWVLQPQSQARWPPCVLCHLPERHTSICPLIHFSACSRQPMVPPLPGTCQALHKGHSSKCPQAFCPFTAMLLPRGDTDLPCPGPAACPQVLAPTLCTVAPVVRRFDVVMTVTMATTDPSLDTTGLHARTLVLCPSAPLRIPEPSITPRAQCLPSSPVCWM